MSPLCLHTSPEALAWSSDPEPRFRPLFVHILVLIDLWVKIIGAYYRDVLLALHLLPVISSNVCWMCRRNEGRVNEDQMWMTKRRSRNEHHKRLAEIRNRRQQSLQTFVSFYLLNKMLLNVGIVLLIQFSKYLESFSIIWSGIRYIWHEQFGLGFIKSPCICIYNVFKYKIYFLYPEVHRIAQELKH